MTPTLWQAAKYIAAYLFTLLMHVEEPRSELGSIFLEFFQDGGSIQRFGKRIAYFIEVSGLTTEELHEWVHTHAPKWRDYVLGGVQECYVHFATLYFLEYLEDAVERAGH